MAPNVISVSREELIARRDEILKRVGVSRDELRRREESYTLAGDEYEAVTELSEIEFLLDG